LQAEDVKKRFGGVDILVNNAGVVCGKSLLKCQAKEIQHTIDVNLMSQFWASYAPSFSCLYTVKPVFFVCPIFREFRNLGDIAKICSKFHAILAHYLVQQAKTPKLRVPK